jgi:hypothetical protein
MLAGAIIVIYIFGPCITSELDISKLSNGDYFALIWRWTIWPGTALMISSAITAVVVRWRSMANALHALRFSIAEKYVDMSIRSVGLWTVALVSSLVLIHKLQFGMSILQSITSSLVAIPLMFVCVRVNQYGACFCHGKYPAARFCLFLADANWTKCSRSRCSCSYKQPVTCDNARL